MNVRIDEKPWGRSVVVTDDNGVEQQVARIIKDRRALVSDDEFSLDQASMVGSWFLVITETEGVRDIIWQGVIVAEPDQGRYLCDIDTLEPGAEKIQRLFTLDTMLGLGDEGRRYLENSVGEASAPVINPSVEWRFFDSEMKALRAYQDFYLSSRTESREEAS